MTSRPISSSRPCVTSTTTDPGAYPGFTMASPSPSILKTGMPAWEHIGRRRRGVVADGKHPADVLPDIAVEGVAAVVDDRNPPPAPGTAALPGRSGPDRPALAPGDADIREARPEEFLKPVEFWLEPGDRPEDSARAFEDDRLRVAVRRQARSRTASRYATADPARPPAGNGITPGTNEAVTGSARLAASFVGRVPAIAVPFEHSTWTSGRRPATKLNILPDSGSSRLTRHEGSTRARRPRSAAVVRVTGAPTRRRSGHNPATSTSRGQETDHPLHVPGVEGLGPCTTMTRFIRAPGAAGLSGYRPDELC